MDLPGDRLLTLMMLAFGSVTGKQWKVVHPSPAPDVNNLCGFLLESGVTLSRSEDCIALEGNGYTGTLHVTDEVPDSVLHIIVAAAACIVERVVIPRSTESRNRCIRQTISLLQRMGIVSSAVSDASESYSIAGFRFSPEKPVEVSTAREMEIAAAVALASGTPAPVVCVCSEAGSAISRLRPLGLKTSDPQKDKTTPSPLERRLARIAGEKTPDQLVLDWHAENAVVEVPGDATLAAALAGAAALTPRSDVIIRRVLWEPGHRVFFETLKRMRGLIDWTHIRRGAYDSADLHVRWSALEGVQVTARTVEAELLLVAAVASFAKGETLVRCSDSAQECDLYARKALVDGLEMFGAHVGNYPEGIVVKGGPDLHGNLVDSAGMSQVALALAVAGVAAGGETVIFGCAPDEYPLCSFLELMAFLAQSQKQRRER